eukprot:SAG11_NODE_2261_length_3608_cov_8.203192_2_plen_112_part_00
MYFFTANQVETERWIDQVSHAVIAYNRLDPAQIAEMYEEKEAKTRGTFDTVQNTVRRTLNARKKEMPMHWTLVIQWFETYFADLFVVRRGVVLTLTIFGHALQRVNCWVRR